uniref:hypothetical protein n=1 Tax=uncultured Phascolarctobacterium sp. TaxID=512296 RepID=UPI0026002246
TPANTSQSLLDFLFVGLKFVQDYILRLVPQESTLHNITFLKYFCVKTILNCINLYFLIILYNSFIILPQMSPPTRHEKDFSKIFFQRRDITLRGTCGKPQVRVRASLAKWRKHRKKTTCSTIYALHAVF